MRVDGDRAVEKPIASQEPKVKRRPFKLVHCACAYAEKPIASQEPKVKKKKMAKLTHNLIIFNDCVKLIARRRDDIFSIICLYKSKQKQFRIMYRYGSRNY